MIKQAFGRACLSLLSVCMMGLFLSACGGDGDSIRSPDLPAPTLQSMSFTCAPDQVSAGTLSQCTASCVFSAVDEDGNETLTTGCPNFNCRSADGSIAVVESVDNASDTCAVRGVSVGVVDIVGTTNGGGVTEVLEVLNANITQFNITPDAMSLPVGVSQQAQAFAEFSDGVTRNVTNSTTWTSADAGIASVADGSPVKGLITGQALGDTVVTGTYSSDNNFLDTVNVTVRDAAIVTDGLCVTPAPADYSFNATAPCRAFNPVDDACSPGTTTVGINGQQLFVAFAEFDDGQYCDVSRNVAWTLDPALTDASVGDGPDDGLFQAGETTGNTNVTAVYSVGGANETAAAPVTISGNAGRLASNSLNVGIPTEDTNGDGSLNGADDLQKVFCIGAYDLVMGLQQSDDLPATKQVYASHRICEDDATSGPCAEADFGDVVTPANATINQVSWRIGGDYFTGGQCVTSSTGPLGGDNAPPAGVGNVANFLGTEINDPTVKGNVFTGDAESASVLRLGTACVEGELTLPGTQGSAVDGATAIVLPATSDEVLGQAVQLCNTLVPLFLLGGDDGAGATIQLVAALSDVLNPLLVALGDGVDGTGLDTVLDQVLVAVSDNLTGQGAPLEPLITPLLNDVVGDIVDTNVFSPVNCALGALLQGLLGGDPSEIQALAECAPSP